MSAQVHSLLPTHLPGGYIVEYYTAAPEIGGIEVIVWRTEQRDDGFVVHCTDWRAVHHTMRGMLDAGCSGGSQMTINPKAFVGLPSCIQHLTNEQRWVVWKWENRTDKNGNTKRTKPPRQPNGSYAHNDNPETWATFAEVSAVKGFDGVGLQLLNLKGFAALDLDNVRDPATGTILPWAAEVIACGSYAEATPSGKGFRVLGAVAADHAAMHRKIQHPGGGEIEFYVSMETGRYITITGQRVPQAPDALAPIDAIIERLLAVVQPKADEQAKGFDFGRAKGLQDLPQWVQDVITHGGTGDRSADFQAVVNAMFARMTFEDALRILEAYPQGPAGKYAGRLEKELRRSWDKASSSQSSHGEDFQRSAKPHPENWGEADPKYLRTILPPPPTLPLDDVFGRSWAEWIRVSIGSQT